jgi:hypothetical protein
MFLHDLDLLVSQYTAEFFRRYILDVFNTQGIDNTAAVFHVTPRQVQSLVPISDIGRPEASTLCLLHNEFLLYTPYILRERKTAYRLDE